LCGASPYAQTRMNYFDGNGTPSSVVYSRTVKVITHELGHNLGCNHTFGCYWNLSWTPGASTFGSGRIDGSGGATYNPQEGSCTIPAIPPGFLGTIMSYCDSTGLCGVSFALGFGPIPRQRMIDRINTTTCTTTCSEPLPTPAPTPLVTPTPTKTSTPTKTINFTPNPTSTTTKTPTPTKTINSTPNQFLINNEELKLKVEQMQLYQKHLIQIEESKKYLIDLVESKFTMFFTDRCITDSFKESIYKFIKKLGVEVVMESMTIACKKMDTPSKSLDYFCGICWNKIRQNEN